MTVIVEELNVDQILSVETNNKEVSLSRDISANSCGIIEIDDLIRFNHENFTPKEITESIKAVIGFLKNNKRAAFVTFSVPRKDSYAKIISVLNNIKKTSPGSVSTSWRKNPNTDNMIKVWIF